MIDPHGRTAHGDTDRRRRPASGFRLRSARRFAELVEDCLYALPGPLRRRVAAARLRIVDVPGGAGTADRVAAFDADANTLIVYRRTAELRADSRAFLSEVVALGVADALNEEPRYVADDRTEPSPDRDD